MLNLRGMRIVVFGVANEFSICWPIVLTLIKCGAEVTLCSHPQMLERVTKLVKKSVVKSVDIFTCDVTDDTQVDRCFEELAKHAPYQGCVHGIAFSPPEGVQGNFLDAATRDAIRVAMDVSVASFTTITGRMVPLMPNGGSILTLTFDASDGVYPYYNVMALAKAALNIAVKYAAAELGVNNIRVNAISASPENTMSARGVEKPYTFRDWTEAMSPMGRRATVEEIAAAAAWLLSPYSSGTTGEISFVDCGFNIVKMIDPSHALKMLEAMQNLLPKT